MAGCVSQRSFAAAAGLIVTEVDSGDETAEPEAPPVIPAETVGIPHEYVVPTGTITPLTPLIGKLEKVPPLQISAVIL